MKFINFNEINSTNEYLRRKIKSEEFEVVIAKKQHKDNVKIGKMWISNEGGAFFSFPVNYKIQLEEKINVLAGCIVCEVLKKYIASALSKKEAANLKFKWPNDIYYNEKKICGIFCEKIRDKIIVGIRININNTDFGKFKSDAVSLFEICKIKYIPEEIIEKIVILFEAKINNVNKEWEKTLFSINQLSYLNNKKIKIEKNGKYLEKEYRILRIDRNGRISIIGKGDRDEIKFSTLRYKIVKN